MEETVPNEGFPDWREAEEAGAAPLFERLFGANENSKRSFTKTGSGQTWGKLKKRDTFLYTNCQPRCSSF
jgi:hypothetical protein